jgi:hypothetical protein
MSNPFDLSDDGDDQLPEYKLYLTPEGRKKLGLPEIVLTIRLPAPGSACVREISELLGEEVSFDRSKAISLPWLALTKLYREARDQYRKAAAPYVPDLDEKAREQQSIEFTQRTNEARHRLGIETERAVAAAKILAHFFVANAGDNTGPN